MQYTARVLHKPTKRIHSFSFYSFSNSDYDLKQYALKEIAKDLKLPYSEFALQSLEEAGAKSITDNTTSPYGTNI